MVGFEQFQRFGSYASNVFTEFIAVLAQKILGEYLQIAFAFAERW